MASSSTSGTAEQLAKPEYRNWLALGHALTTVFCKGLRPFIKREMETFYRNLTPRVAGPCTCVHVPRRKRNEYHDMRTCAWAIILEACHKKSKPNWKQSDATKWLDPVLGPWEIAKLFLPDLGGHADIKSANDMDITGILNLMYWCNHFTIPQHLINDVRDTRNDKWVHVPKLELTDVDKTVAFDSIENLLKDPQLGADPDVQKCLREIVNLKSVSDLHSLEAQVLADFKDVLTRRSRKRQKEVDQLKLQVSLLEQRLKVLEQDKGLFSFLHIMLKGLGNAHSKLVRSVKGISKGNLVLWLLMSFLCGFCLTPLDNDTFIRDGCPAEDLRVPFDTQEYDWLDYLSTSKEKFIGRQWLFRELEETFHVNDLTGVLIIGDPGTGKSALSAQLVCSRTSSRTIYNQILGYHLCKHSDKNTQIAGKFVRNLAEMIARRLPEYGYIVSNSTHIQRSLDTDCVNINDPVGCFEQTILTPLRRLTNKPREKWFVVVDALDECSTHSETKHSIIHLLKQKLPRLPSWLKLIMTSRKESSVFLTSNSVKSIIIDPEDPRNLGDIELFLTTRFYRDGPLLRRLKVWFGDDSIENTEKLISALLNKSQGNFLFVKEMLRHWESSKQAQSDPYALPKSLGELYHSFLERLYNRKETFKPVERILEILVSTFEPLTQNQLFHVLISGTKEANLEDFQDRMSELGNFLRYGKNGTVTLYHLSLSDWLTNENNRNGQFYVSKKKGHEVFCDYYFNLIRKGDNLTLLTHIPTLVQHIALAGWKEKYVQEFLSFPSQVVNSSDPNNKRTLLHLVATINNSDVLELVLRHFQRIDSVDTRGITPAFLAAKHGLVDNLALLVGGGANVNHKTNLLISRIRDELKNAENKTKKWDNFNILLVLKSKYEFWGSTMLHVAAHQGHLGIVNFLLNTSALISTLSEVNLSALQLAAEEGHVEVVKALYEAGAVADQTALHHAAGSNRLEVVKYLLEIGIKDECMRCDGSFYWLNSKRRFHYNRWNYIDDEATEKCNCSKDSSLEGTCAVLMSVKTFPSVVDDVQLFDDGHLMICETALHAAVSSEHNDIVHELLARDNRALGCHDYSGRTPLHEAVRKNNQPILELLLTKQQTSINAPCYHWQDVQGRYKQNEPIELGNVELFWYEMDICHCGYTPLHLAARYGHKNIGMHLINSGAQVDAPDCHGATPLHVAACHNQLEFIYFLFSLTASADVNSRALNGSTPLHTAAACSAVKAIDLLLYFGANLTATDNDGLTALHYTIVNLHSRQLNEVTWLSYRTTFADPGEQIRVGGYPAEFYQDNNQVKNTKGYGWLDSLLHLIRRGSDINAVDKNGRTSLHIAAENGLYDAVNVLLQTKAGVDIRNKFGKTPLEAAIENATSGLPSIIFESSFDEIRKPLLNHDYVVYLLLAFGASFNGCQPTGSLLHHSVINNHPNIAKLLLLKGASIICRDSLGRTPTIAYLHNGRNWMDFIFQHFNASAGIQCGEPFNLSVFHLVSYRSPRESDFNFLAKRLCDDHKCSSLKSPITLLVEGYFTKYKHKRPIDSCLDAEGFTPLHRAVQGANVVAVRNLIKHGANVSLLTPQGHDALTLAILHAGSNSWRYFNTNETLKTMEKASAVALELLRHKMKSSGFKIVCDSTKAALTLYHLAASRGLTDFIKEIFKNKTLHQLNVDCPNRDGITPMYLARIFGNVVEVDVYNPWKEVVQFIREQGGQMHYPTRGAEYNTIYNRLYGWIPWDMNLNIRPDVRGFVLGLLSTYRFWQNSSVGCSLNEINNTHMEIGSAISVLRIGKELLRQLELLNREEFLPGLVSRALKDLRVCQEEFNRIELLRTAYSRHTRILAHSPRRTLKINFYKVHIGLVYLMKMWHGEVFRHYACHRMAFDAYQPYFVDNRRSKLLIKRYEESTPLWYFNNICFKFKHAFQLYILSYSLDRDYTALKGFFEKYPGFVRERMGWTEWDLLSADSWPLEFLVKFSLGLYRKYDYLRVLNVGLEQNTYISLHSDKMRQLLLQLKKQ